MTMKKFAIGLSVFCCATAAYAANESWSLQLIEGFQIARVTNDAALATGVICSINEQSCRAYVTMPASCEVDAGCDPNPELVRIRSRDFRLMTLTPN